MRAVTDIVGFEFSLESSSHSGCMLKDVVLVACFEQAGNNICIVPIGKNADVVDVLTE